GFVGYTVLSFGIHFRALALTADLVGLIFLIAMTLTSFRWLARRLSRANWRHLHKAGAYAIWLLALHIYHGGAHSDRDLFHFVALGVLLAAGGMRMVAWLRKWQLRRNAVSHLSPGSAY